ncbi:leukotriene A-4 hydrolase-like [Pogonomyrmex barbatus]|uniref:Leukotriene A-4 hydrolase-like n=1 Tax=Pogonomyrmex barbatus TaxID=144034 RepID=A0A8N1S5W9_9HYME|nr:leukotriene A-4 hydrolase-like [Pogonomyrmex barbatus]
MYARAMFPCQDTPSVKSKYSAMISAPKCCTVRMSLHQQKILKVSHQYVCEFSQKAPLPSYVIVIVVGFLQCQKFNNRCNVLFEMKYGTQQVFRMASNIKKLMHVAESIYGALSRRGNETKRLLQQKLSNDLWDKKVNYKS